MFAFVIDTCKYKNEMLKIYVSIGVEYLAIRNLLKLTLLH